MSSWPQRNGYFSQFRRVRGFHPACPKHAGTSIHRSTRALINHPHPHNPSTKRCPSTRSSTSGPKSGSRHSCPAWPSHGRANPCRPKQTSEIIFQVRPPPSHLWLWAKTAASEHMDDNVAQARTTSSSGSTPCSSATCSRTPTCNRRYPPPACTPHPPPTPPPPHHAAHCIPLALARTLLRTTPDAPQEEREDLLDVLAQELASAVHTELRGRTYTKVREGLYLSDLSSP